MQKNLSPVEAREAVHLLILRELVKLKNSDAVVLKGGVNLRVFFGSVRYSQDMDLDGAPEAASAIRGALNGIFGDRAFLREAQRIGIRGLDPGEGPNKDTETTFRYKFGVILPGDIRHPTKVEVSYRERYAGDVSLTETPPAEFFATYGLAPVPVHHYGRHAAVRQKIDALGGRREVQARDVFDLHALTGGEMDEALLSFLAAGLSPARLEEAYNRALSITFKEYEGQVLEFLAEDARARYGAEDAWDELRLEAAALTGAALRRKGAS
ncbi:MAG: nucleotidyl transferase AbiEii/AbiGii toxin family protein [Longimicrobiales bacterium]|nr:nucleotidyl transferase AbiEii/AbiGii toxin family protein [Longimicrobiales bacterium]